VLILSVRINDCTYAIPTRWIVEVVPLVLLRPVAQAPHYLSGVCNYRGRIAPVIDLGELLDGKACHRRLSTRIVFVAHPDTAGPLLGLIAEGVTETLELPDVEFESAITVRVNATPYLGPLVQHEIGLVQLFDIGAMLDPARELQHLLSATPIGSFED
jgi:chemotaxis-related protein WspB